MVTAPPRNGTGKGARKRHRLPRRTKASGGAGAAAPKRPRGRPKAQPPSPAAPFPPALLRARPPRITNAKYGRAGEDGAPPVFGAASSDMLCLPNPDWLRHTLEVSGPADALVGFRAAAAGAGAIPWRVPIAELEEGWFNLMVATAGQHGEDGGVSVAGARVIAGQLAEAVRARADASALLDWAGEGRRSCPLDLHALVPVPTEVLAVGPDDPRAQLWLWEHWGTTWPLRGVTAEERPSAGEGRAPPAGRGMVRFAFHSADWSPWRALERLRARWPALAFALRPDYGDAAAIAKRSLGEMSAKPTGPATAAGPTRRCRRVSGKA